MEAGSKKNTLALTILMILQNKGGKLIKIIIKNSFEVDNAALDKWCFKNQVSLRQGKSYLKEKMIKNCKEYLKKEVEN